jgi:hypothetical protein
MVTVDGTESAAALDDVMEDIPRGVVRRVTAADRESNWDVYGALENE